MRIYGTVIDLLYIVLLTVLSDAHRDSYWDGVSRRRGQEDAKILSLWT